jgi:mRNA interferase MazF
MAGGVRRGDVWMYEFRRPDKLRPVVVLSREDAIGVLHTVMVAPVTSTIRGIPSEVVIGIDEGLKHTSAINLDHVQTVEQSRLKRCLGRVRGETLARLCQALAVAFACER